MSRDLKTIRVYKAEAARYAEVTRDADKDPCLHLFLDHLPPQGTLLDLGCGPGIAARVMATKGHSVIATDATPEMVKMAAAHPGVTARLATFDDVDEQAVYDGIWANFSLLHAPRADLPRHLAALSAALKPQGIFHIGMKIGSGELRDKIGRRYTYVTEQDLTDLLRDARLEPFETRTGEDPGLDGTVAAWVTILARKALA